MALLRHHGYSWHVTDDKYEHTRWIAKHCMVWPVPRIPTHESSDEHEFQSLRVLQGSTMQVLERHTHSADALSTFAPMQLEDEVNPLQLLIDGSKVSSF